MASTSVTKAYDELVTFTYEKYGHKFVQESIFQGNPLMKYMMMNGRYQPSDGGTLIIEPISLSKNTTAAFVNQYDNLNINPQVNATAALYNYAQATAQIIISTRERAQNSGETAIINMLNFKMKHAADSLKDLISISLYGNQDDSDNKSLIGMQYMVADSPSATSVGKIATSEVQWRNYAATMAVAGGNASFGTTSSGVTGFRKALKKVTFGADVPDIIVVDEATYVAYETAVGGTQQTLVPAGLGDLGFQSLQLSGIPIVWDRHVPGSADGTGANYQADSTGATLWATGTGRAYFLNTNHLVWKYHPDKDFALSEPTRPVNGLFTCWNIETLFQLINNARRTCGVINTIAV